VSPVYARHLIGVVHNPGFLKRFQLLQEGVGRFLLLVEVPSHIAPDAFDRFERRVRRDLHTVLGQRADLEVRRTSAIPGGDSEKFLYTRNLVAGGG
jgi:hypothetical protein